MASEILEQMRAYYARQKEKNRGAVIPDEALAAMLPEIRKETDKMSEQITVLPLEITCMQKAVRGQEGEYYTYDDSDPDKRREMIVLYIHGGAFENGTYKSRRYAVSTLCRFLKADGYSMEYTQWPEGFFEQGLQECICVYHALIDTGFRPENIVLAGESAGATMILAMTLALKERKEALPGKLIAMCPVTDLEDTFASRKERDDLDPMIMPTIGRDMLRHYYRGENPKDPCHSVRYGNYDHFPPTCVIVGSDEVLYDDSVDLHEQLQKAGTGSELHVCKGLFHAFEMIPAPESELVLKKAADFILGVD